MRWSETLCIGMAGAVWVAAALAQAPDSAVKRGEYLVAVSSCTNCHTPGHFRGHEDGSQFLAGSEVGFDDPVKGVVVGPNLTPDKETGLGSWSDQQIVNAMTRGVLPNGQALSMAMPWAGLAHLSQSDARAIVAYLRSLPAVKRRTPGPFAPGTAATVAVLRLTAPSVKGTAAADSPGGGVGSSGGQTSVGK